MNIKMELFNKNQNYLGKMRRAIFASVAAERAFEPEDDARYGKKDGHYLAERQNIRCFVQSRYSIPDEMESMFSSVPRNTGQIMLFGLGRGEAVSHALNPRNFPQLKDVIVIEPSPKWAQIVMNEVDLEELWGEDAGKITLLVGHRPELVGALIAAENISLGESCFPVWQLSSRTMFSGYYREIFAGAVNYVNNIKLSMGSKKRMAHKKIYNEVLNLALPACDFTDIEDLFKGKNVIIVSAGPSLEKNIHLLEEAKKKAIVIAVGTAIRILDERGITPHFRMALDPFPAEQKIFAALKDRQTPLICTNALYYEILPDYKGLLIRINTNVDHMSQLLHKKKDRKMTSLPLGPSVTDLATAAFCSSGCKRLVFIGQDMCMYNYQLYADASEEAQYRNQGEHKNILHLKDIFGNDVVSPRNFYMIKLSLEKLVALFGDKVEFINATEGGLGINGVPDKILAEVLCGWEEDDAEQVIDERLKNVFLIDFHDELWELEGKISDIDRLNDENLKNLQKTKDIFLQDSRLLKRDKYIKAFQEAQKIENKLRKIDWYAEFIQVDLKLILEEEYCHWGKDVDSTDEKARFRSILEMQLLTAQAVKSYTVVLKSALEFLSGKKDKVNL